jgi:hypothetical protein
VLFAARAIERAGDARAGRRAEALSGCCWHCLGPDRFRPKRQRRVLRALRVNQNNCIWAGPTFVAVSLRTLAPGSGACACCWMALPRRSRRNVRTLGASAQPVDAFCRGRRCADDRDEAVTLRANCRRAQGGNSAPAAPQSGRRTLRVSHARPAARGIPFGGLSVVRETQHRAVRTALVNASAPGAPLHSCSRRLPARPSLRHPCRCCRPIVSRQFSVNR